MREIKIGSLFDGSGGFPLAGIMKGMNAVWASEVEPYPIRVTTKRIPFMKHLGDINKMNGAEIEPVDVVCGGSPCQDMSVAGKRAGLDGERSGLFREQIRIIKEMREATHGQYPRYMVWENVPGALSSNKGADFRCVLEETARIKDARFNVPMPEKNKWNTAGLIMGEDFSIAWRILDAQYWGVPQRRRRIFLVADFSGTSSGEILFKREGLSWHFTQSRESWQTVAGNFEIGIDPTGESPVYSIDREAMNAGYKFDRAPGIDESGLAYTLKATGPGGVAHPAQSAKTRNTIVFKADDGSTGDVSPTLVGDHNNRVTDHSAIVVEPVCAEVFHCTSEIDKTPVLKARDYKDPHVVAFDRAAFNQGQNAQYNPQFFEDGTNPTLIARGPNGVCSHYIVRRLTPLECARLQGFPDWWTADLGTKEEDITEEEMQFWREVFETHRTVIANTSKPKTDNQIRKWLMDPNSDSAEYKMWGNGVALPCVLYVMEGIALELRKGDADEE